MRFIFFGRLVNIFVNFSVSDSLSRCQDILYNCHLETEMEVIFQRFPVVLGSNFGAFDSLEGVWALPGAPWGPLGGQGAPNMGPGSEKLVR